MTAVASHAPADSLYWRLLQLEEGRFEDLALIPLAACARMSQGRAGGREPKAWSRQNLNRRVDSGSSGDGSSGLSYVLVKETLDDFSSEIDDRGNFGFLRARCVSLGPDDLYADGDAHRSRRSDP